MVQHRRFDWVETQAVRYELKIDSYSIFFTIYSIIILYILSSNPNSCLKVSSNYANCNLMILVVDDNLSWN